MKPCMKIISAITLICFSLTNISFAQEINSFKLAPPSSFSSMKGPEFKEAAQIQAGVRSALKELRGFDINFIKALEKRQFFEKTVFGKRIEGTIYFNKAVECTIKGKDVFVEKGSYLLKAATRSGKLYYCLISREEHGAGYDISVISERVFDEALKNGTVKFAHASINEKDRAIIGSYTEHEISTENNIAIDEWIAQRMMRGEYTVDHENVKSPLYQHLNRNFYNRRGYTDLLAKISEYLVTIGVKRENIDKIALRMLKTPLVLIPYEDEAVLPTITIVGEKIKVYAHSSEFATYIFLPGPLYGSISKNTIWNDEVKERVERDLTHEIGAICGLKATVENGRAWNLLDEAVSALKADKTAAPLHELQDLSPVNLLDLELRNDYAAGDVEKKSIFNRVITLMLAGLISVLSSCSITTEAEKKAWPWEGWSWGGIDVKTDLVDSAIIGVFNESETCKKLRQTRVFSEYLGSVGNRKAIEFLLDAAENSKNGQVRGHAVFALSKIVDGTDKNILDKLMALLERKSPGKDWNVWESENRYVMDALGAIGDERAVTAIIDYAHMYQLSDLLDRAEKALVRIGPKALPFVIDRLKSVHAECIGWEKTQWGSGIRSLHYLEEMLYARALPELFKQADGETIALLIQAINDKDDWMRNLAREILPYSRNALIGALNNKDQLIRTSAARLLNEREKSLRQYRGGLYADNEDEKNIDLLVEAIKDREPEVSSVATRILARQFNINNTRVQELLILLLGDKREFIREIVRADLVHMSNIGPLDKHQFVIDMLKRALKNENPLIRINAIMVLEDMGYEHWVSDKSIVRNIIKQCAGDKDIATQEVVQEALKIIKKQELIENLINADKQVQKNTEEEIIKMHNLTEKDVTFLIETLTGGDLIDNYSRGFRFFEKDAVVAREFIQIALKAMAKKSSLIAIFKEGYFTRMPKERLIELLKELNEKESSILCILYFTNIDDLERTTDSDFMAAVDDNIFETTISKRYDNPIVIDSLDKLEDIDPDTMKQIAGAFRENPFWGGGKLTWATMDSLNLADDIRYHELVRRSVIMKLLVQEGDVKIDDTIKALFRWSNSSKEINLLPLLWDKSDIPRLKRLLNSPFEYYRRAAGKALDQIERGNNLSVISPKEVDGPQEEKKESPAPTTKPKGSSMLDAKPAIPEYIKTQMDTIGATIPALGVMQFSASEKVDAVTEILWQTGLGSVSVIQAKEKLAGLVPEAGKTAEERNRVYDAWIAQAKATMLAMSIRLTKYSSPNDEGIRQITARIKEEGIEVFIPKSQFPGDTISKYRGIIEAVGGKLRVYQHVEDLQAMIKNPVKSMVMTVDAASKDAELLEALKASAEGLRFMNFAKMEDLGSMSPDELDNYEAEILGILLIARVITPEDFQDKGSSAYRMLSHLLEDYMPEGVHIDDYIYDIVTSAARLIKTILKALPAAAYKTMRQSVEVLWAA